ncbi:DUF6318 family protein [Arthrobacter ramosus]|uniref:DUF6318 family protein n=1 Tax=Arthrobacter ramosus TaxID=1672 RepID=A0ABV5Y2K0_ARTRM|nr:DUF6318 family protein [Arthrobacter ramosus]
MTPRTSVSARNRLFVIVSLATALTLTACENSTQPQAEQSATPTGSATATVTPSPSPAYKPADAKGKAENVPVPVLPEAAKANSKEGVEAFARYWFQALSYAYETGDASIVDQISGPNCVLCRGLKDTIKLAWADGKWIAGGTLQTPSVSAKFSPGAESQQATVQVIHLPVTIYKIDGTLYQEPTKGSNRASQMVTKFDANGWTAIDLGLIR